MLYIFLKSFVTYCQWKHFAKTAPFLSNLFIYISLHIFISLTCYVTLFYFVSLEGGEGIVTANSRDCSANYPNTWGNTSLRSINVYKHSKNIIKIIALHDVRWFVFYCNERLEISIFIHMTHSQMLRKVEYALPAKIWRLVGCTEMLSW